MAITKGAKKALRASERKRVFNTRRKNVMNDSVKAVKKLVASGAKVEAEKLISTAYQAIDKAEKRGVIKKNTAARKKSRLVASLKRQKKYPHNEDIVYFSGWVSDTIKKLTFTVEET